MFIKPEGRQNLRQCDSKIKQNVKTIIWIIFVLIGYRITGQIFLHIHWGPQVLGSNGAFFLSMGRKMCQLVYIILLLWGCDWLDILSFHRKSFRRGMKIALPLFIIYGIIFAIAVLKMEGLISDISSNDAVTKEFIIQQFIYFFAGTALTEELFFRGIIMRKLAFLNKLKPGQKWNMAVVGQAVLFGVMHGWQLIEVGNYAGGCRSMAGAVIGGWLYGIIFAKSKSIWPAVILHGFYDFAMILLMH